MHIRILLNPVSGISDFIVFPNAASDFVQKLLWHFMAADAKTGFGCFDMIAQVIDFQLSQVGPIDEGRGFGSFF